MRGEVVTESDAYRFQCSQDYLINELNQQIKALTEQTRLYEVQICNMYDCLLYTSDAADEEDS
eukprot:627942-Amorphochlora_amoeboformis.AAC.1